MNQNVNTCHIRKSSGGDTVATKCSAAVGQSVGSYSARDSTERTHRRDHGVTLRTVRYARANHVAVTRADISLLGNKQITRDTIPYGILTNLRKHIEHESSLHVQRITFIYWSLAELGIALFS